jgi:hypothetical protein
VGISFSQALPSLSVHDVSIDVSTVEIPVGSKRRTLRIDVVSFNVCSLIEHVRDRSQVAYKYVLSSQRIVLQYYHLAMQSRGLRSEAPDKFFSLLQPMPSFYRNYLQQNPSVILDAQRGKGARVMLRMSEVGPRQEPSSL